jgi:hypothetical protein
MDNSLQDVAKFLPVYVDDNHVNDARRKEDWVHYVCKEVLVQLQCWPSYEKGIKSFTSNDEKDNEPIQDMRDWIPAEELASTAQEEEVQRREDFLDFFAFRWIFGQFSCSCLHDFQNLFGMTLRCSRRIFAFAISPNIHNVFSFPIISKCTISIDAFSESKL